MATKRWISALATGLLLANGIVWAEHNEGTGTPQQINPSEHNEGSGLQLTLDGPQRLLLQLADGQALIAGSGELEHGYGQLTLDALGTQAQPGWGYAEVLLACGSADVLVYRYNAQGQAEEVSAQQVEVAGCHGE